MQKNAKIMLKFDKILSKLSGLGIGADIPAPRPAPRGRAAALREVELRARGRAPARVRAALALREVYLHAAVAVKISATFSRILLRIRYHIFNISLFHFSNSKKKTFFGSPPNLFKQQ